MSYTTRPTHLDAIHHDGSARYVRPAAGAAPRLGDEITLRLRTGRAAAVQRVLLRTCPDGEQAFSEMRPADESPVCRWWEVTLRLTMPVTGYRFLVVTEEGAWWYNGLGLQQHTPTDADDFRILADYAAPAWVGRSVFYQIFPDRFADGDPDSNVRDGEWEYRDMRTIARPWGEPPAQGWAGLWEFYGGDLPGIEARLDYLAETGINALYLNPIFTAYSNHRYDVADYDAVDPHLGGNAALAGLRRALSAREMRYILDIVPNHCGMMHPWFLAAQADPQAPSAEYFIFHNHPADYACWLGHPSLPKLNYRSAALREVMYAGPDAIFRRWLRPPYAADGWRIDVANMLGQQGADQLGAEIARGVRQAVKAENPQAYLMGEHFFDGTPQLQGDCWDATMNYSGFTKPLRYWLSGFALNQHNEPRVIRSPGRWPTTALVDTWAGFRAAIPWTIACQQFNLLDSHDTPRIKVILGGDPALHRLAAGIQLTYPGVPCIYYGDEIGLPLEFQPGDDPEQGARATRACMPWDREQWDGPLWVFYRKLIHLRRTAPALIEGGFQILAAEPDTLIYLRDTDDQQLIVVAHRGPGERPAGPVPVAHGAIADGAEFVEALDGARITVAVGHLPLSAVPAGITIWVH